MFCCVFAALRCPPTSMFLVVRLSCVSSVSCQRRVEGCAAPHCCTSTIVSYGSSSFLCVCYVFCRDTNSLCWLRCCQVAAVACLNRFLAEAYVMSYCLYAVSTSSPRIRLPHTPTHQPLDITISSSAPRTRIAVNWDCTKAWVVFMLDGIDLGTDYWYVVALRVLSIADVCILL